MGVSKTLRDFAVKLLTYIPISAHFPNTEDQTPLFTLPSICKLHPNRLDILVIASYVFQGTDHFKKLIYKKTNVVFNKHLHNFYLLIYFLMQI